ncbi:GNAT family N-acetyltransferase [Flaviaesturariibacter amylovorans]|uniref:N-acetyltransferase domain-containing protein n=1 Tax=Flaviaesturariibacter amylovorans TaxID=1084520 RepID=A0ABP8HUJ7_9BACT
MSVSIRTATVADLDTLYEFEQGVIAAERPFDPTLRPGHISYYDLAAMLDDPLVDLVVAEHEGRVIGSGYARVQAAKAFNAHPEYAYLGFMYVRPEYRGQGVNAQVLEALRTRARGRGLTELRLEVYAENAAAIRAYEKAGFAPLLVEMRMKV